MGPRVCLGAAFALQEATLILAQLVRRWRLEAVEGHEPRPVGRLTIRSANGVRLRLHRRAVSWSSFFGQSDKGWVVNFSGRVRAAARSCSAIDIPALSAVAPGCRSW